MTCGRGITDAQIFNLKENSASLQQSWSGTSNSRYMILQPEINRTWVFGSLGVACYCTDLPSRFITLDSCCHSVTPKSKKQRPCVITHNLTLFEAHHHLQAVMAEIESSYGGILKSSSSHCRFVTPKSKKPKPYIIKHDLTIALLNSKSKEEKKTMCHMILQ